MSGLRPRPTATPRTTESSVRVSIGRSCTRKPSATLSSRSSASPSRKAIGSSETLPLVSTSASAPEAARSASRTWCSGAYGSITPSSDTPGATAHATGAPGLRGASTIGRAPETSSVALDLAELDELVGGRRVAHHQRERPVLAALARAQLRDGVPLAASQARW